MQTPSHTHISTPEAYPTRCCRGAAFWVYLLLSLGVLGYVGLLTGNRAEKLDADAWEHHRAVLAMSQEMWEPGNPTYAGEEPSIRYSPYTIALAQIVRSTGIDAYDALSGAAVFNTLLLLIAVWCWLRAYGMQAAAPLVLLSVLFLYGTPPGYANSLALSDLPWHQVNPSALAMPLMILAWAWLYRAKGLGLIAFTVVTSVLLAGSVLSHGMSGVLGAFGLFITAVASDRNRVAKLIATFVTCGIGFGLAAAWPWYDFLYAVTKSPDKWYWYNPAIFKMMLFSWCLPAFIASLAALPMRDKPFVRTALLATAGLLCVTFAGAVAGSPTLARLPLAGLIFPQAAVGVFIYSIGVSCPKTWFARLKQMFDRDRAVMSRALVETTVVGLVVVLALPNFWMTLREPHLARKWVAKLTHKEDKQPHNWARYDALLTPNIKPNDVVLAEPLTGWPVPSFNGRVVSALHLEFFSPGQFERLEDTTKFFSSDTSHADRVSLIQQYGVKWLLLDRELLPKPVFDELFSPDAVTADDGRLVLIDAGRWAQQANKAETRTPQ
ncbi:MAG: hypothetical protein R3C45_17020 [Phycisphaerales bacterium]